jgi:RNA polymerase sigma-70 factor (ECF subfamily)
VDDYAQQALVNILKGLPTYRGDAPLERWADRVTARTTLALAKRRRAERKREAELIENLYPLPMPTSSISYSARRRLAKALDTLPKDQREAVVLHHVLEMTVPEVAAALGVPFETAKSRLRLAMKKLRAELERKEGGDRAPRRA